MDGKEINRGLSPIIREVLARLGLETDSGKGYENHFGISLRSLTPVAIQGSSAHLLAETSVDALTESIPIEDLTVAEEAQLFAEAIWLLAQQTQTSKENEIMWIPNLRSASEFAFGVAISMLAVPSTQAVDNYALGDCNVLQKKFYDSKSIWPFSSAASYLTQYLGGDPDKNIDRVGGSFEGGEITLVKAPQHGEFVLSSDEWEASRGRYNYLPEEGYYGSDRFVVQVEKNGVKVTIHYVVVTIDDEDHPINYCNPNEWKISQPAPEDYNTPDSWYRATSLYALLSGAQTALIGFADLSGASLAQTTASQITLDTTAAGHTWFIDYTPYLNEEWLPTSSPYEWQAKPGSDAEGKMDLLSVLIHEYGHVLGLEHSSDPHDFMATTLQPGQRKLPSAEELQQMADLVAALKGEMGLASASSSTPTQPNTPLPTAPLPASVGLAAFLASRQRRNGTGNSETPTQYEVAANPELTNADFANASGWSATGTVIFDNGAATLNETATAQTRLNQVFVIGENDRYLSLKIIGDRPRLNFGIIFNAIISSFLASLAMPPLGELIVVCPLLFACVHHNTCYFHGIEATLASFRIIGDRPQLNFWLIFDASSLPPLRPSQYLLFSWH